VAHVGGAAAAYSGQRGQPAGVARRVAALLDPAAGEARLAVARFAWYVPVVLAAVEMEPAWAAVDRAAVSTAAVELAPYSYSIVAVVDHGSGVLGTGKSH
jgi:hypothetical protein